MKLYLVQDYFTQASAFSVLSLCNETKELEQVGSILDINKIIYKRNWGVALSRWILKKYGFKNCLELK